MAQVVFRVKPGQTGTAAFSFLNAVGLQPGDVRVLQEVTNGDVADHVNFDPSHLTQGEHLVSHSFSMFL